MSPQTQPRRLLSFAATALAFTFLDLLWLGVIARDFYAKALGPLMRSPAYWPAALTFYLFYLVCVWWWAVDSAADVGAAAKRGAAMGGFSYGVYELTNWAVINGWPGYLVPVDWVWGIVLTGACAAAGKKVRGGL